MLVYKDCAVGSRCSQMRCDAVGALDSAHDQRTGTFLTGWASEKAELEAGRTCIQREDRLGHF